jgi:hypothetical protein
MAAASATWSCAAKPFETRCAACSAPASRSGHVFGASHAYCFSALPIPPETRMLCHISNSKLPRDRLLAGTHGDLQACLTAYATSLAVRRTLGFQSTCTGMHVLSASAPDRFRLKGSLALCGRSWPGQRSLSLLASQEKNDALSLPAMWPCS